MNLCTALFNLIKMSESNQHRLVVFSRNSKIEFEEDDDLGIWRITNDSSIQIHYKTTGRIVQSATNSIFDSDLAPYGFKAGLSSQLRNRLVEEEFKQITRLDLRKIVILVFLVVLVGE